MIDTEEAGILSTVEVFFIGASEFFVLFDNLRFICPYVASIHIESTASKFFNTCLLTKIHVSLLLVSFEPHEKSLLDK